VTLPKPPLKLPRPMFFNGIAQGEMVTASVVLGIINDRGRLSDRDLLELIKDHCEWVLAERGRMLGISGGENA
jgi:hypothetical protein